ncbi:XMAP215 family protein [Histomonas meleagridis]|uniref:XMAP215 family protein n=1 Tax=Histomonas meleagridis TaxID=135588 RepID=UPI003559E9BB|nr:XMAP215 family protein [Histomonas meleagridis]KAH0801351.1 XMAP215 family protein [Histomonas meleagridis]
MMQANEVSSGDWKIRLKAYEDIFQLMSDPSEQILSQLLTELPNYLADENPNCQKVAIMICEKYFKVSPYVNYSLVSKVLIEKCLPAKQQISDIAINLLTQCLKKETDEVLDQLFDGLTEKPSQIILSVISIIVAFLATLTTKDSTVASKVIDKLKPLLDHPDPKVSKEVSAAIASARIVSGLDLDTLTSSLPSSPVSSTNSPRRKRTNDNWITLITSQNWKDRKTGYEELLDSINESSQLSVIEHDFLVPASTEKNVLCEGVIIQIIDKLARTFKAQLTKKLREYITPLMNMFMQKRQSRITTLQKAFDSLATNVVTSPYKPPFLEFLLKMMNSPNARLKEEALAFITRNNNNNEISAQIQEALKNLTTDSNQNVRELASKILGNIGNNDLSNIKHEQHPKSRAVSPDHVRRPLRRKTNFFNLKTGFESWVSPEILTQLNSNQWSSITQGLTSLQEQFDDDPSQPSSVIVGLSSIFTGKTFTPKVMINIMQSLIYYMKSDTEKIHDEALTSAISFAIDNIQEKRFEQQVFEILDLASEINSAQFVFQLLYPQITAKNPILPLRIGNYFSHYLKKYGIDQSINVEEFATQIKPLFTHGDSAVRKIGKECYESIKSYNKEIAENYFSYVKTNKSIKPKKSSPIKQQNNNINNQEKDISYSREQIKPKIRSEIPIPKGIRSFSPSKSSNNQNQNQNIDKSFIPSRIIQQISKTGSILDTRRALDETEIIGLSFKVIIKDQIVNVSTDFLIDVCLLLNFSNKAIRNSTISTLTYLDSIYPEFVDKIFLQAFPKFNVEGKKAAISFLKTLNFEMNIQQYNSLIVGFLSDKSDNYKEAAKPLIEKYLMLPNSVESIHQSVEQFPPAQKNLVISRLATFGKNSIIPFAHTWKEIPKPSDKEQREQMLDPFLPLKVLNSEEQTETLIEILYRYSEKYFDNPEEIISNDPNAIQNVCQEFLELMNNDFNNFSLIIDIIFLWWSTQALLIQVQDGFNQIIHFLSKLLNELYIKNRKLSIYEHSIILPIVFECLGRNESLWEPIRVELLKVCNEKEVITTLVHLLTIASAIFTIVATFKTLMIVLPTIGNEGLKYVTELQSSTKRIRDIIGDNKEKNKELYETVIQFTEFLEKYKKSNENIPINKNNNNKQTKVSKCELSNEILQMIDEPLFAIYQWIIDINSDDTNVSVLALKSISSQMKKDPSVFKPHVDGLIIALIKKMHFQFSINPLPIRLCKYISFCLLTFFNETNLKNIIRVEFVHQIFYELLTHLSNGIVEPVLNQVLNAIIVKLMEDCPMKSFAALLEAIGEYNNLQQFNEKWIRLSIKCFDACGVRICEIGDAHHIAAAIIQIDQFYLKNPVQKIAQAQFGHKVIKAFNSFLSLAFRDFGDELKDTNLFEKISKNSPILEFAGNNQNDSF